MHTHRTLIDPRRSLEEVLATKSEDERIAHHEQVLLSKFSDDESLLAELQRNMNWLDDRLSAARRICGARATSRLDDAATEIEQAQFHLDEAKGLVRGAELVAAE